MKEEDNIQFDQMPDLDWNWGKVREPKKVEETKKEYGSLYDELIDKCNPGKFNIETFGLEKFNAANEIFAQLKNQGSGIPEKDLTLLRDKAIDDLGIQISTKRKFNELKSFLDPKQYINRQPYDKELVAMAGVLYNQLIANKNDIRALEALEKQPQASHLKDEHDYMYLDAVDYIEKHPDGNHKVEAEELLNKTRVQKESWEEREEKKFFYSNTAMDYLMKYPNGKFAELAARLHEETEFRDLPAEKYLEHYPQGRFAEEARYHLQNSRRMYRNKYPDGRYVDDIKDTSAAVAFFGFMAVILIIAIIVGYN